MPLYLTRFNYTPASWAKFIKSPEDRRGVAKTAIEAVGGKMQGFWFAFGEEDALILWEAPDNVSMAATSLAITAGGGVSSWRTFALMSVEETMEAMKKAGSIKYKPPTAG
jgi:uncharacterized protein with GYD domain